MEPIAGTGKREAVAYWLKMRLPFGQVMEFLRHKEVPWHRGSYWYLFGGLALLFFCVQVATGILLMFYYVPTPEHAYESVQLITAKVPFGWLIRSIHSWSANLMILALFIHMFSVFFMRAYRPPREMVWFSGAVLLGLAMFFGFSGYLLPWTKLSFFATKIGTDLARHIPGIGTDIQRILRGGDIIGGPTLTRFFAIHVAILPPIFTVILLLHLVLIQLLGMSSPIGVKEKKGVPFVPNFVLRESIIWVIFLGLLGVLAVYLPWELGEKANPFASAPAGIRPEWFFTFLSQSLKYFPPHLLGMEGEVVGVFLITIGALFFFLVPFWDRWSRREVAHWVVTLVGAAVLLYMITLTTLAFVKPY